MANIEKLSYKGTSYDISDAKALHQDAAGSWMPDFANLKALATYEFDIASTSYYKICERANVTDITALADEVLAFRITTTGSSIFAVADCVVRVQPTVNGAPRVTVNHQTKSTSAATTGVRYLRIVNPKAVNTSYKYVIEIAAYNATARHIKVEVFKTTSDWTFFNTATTFSYNSTNQTATDLTLYDRIGVITSGTIYGTANYATYAGYKSTWDALFNSNYVVLVAGAAIAANQFAFVGEDYKVYPVTNTSQPILTAWPIIFVTSAISSGANCAWSYLRTWGHGTPATSILRDTLAAHDTVYLKCTYTNGKVYSQNRITPTINVGSNSTDTYYKLGVMYNTTALEFNTLGGVYFTVDTDGNMRAINGYSINAERASKVAKAINASTGSYGVLIDDHDISTLNSTVVPSVSNNLTFNPSTGILNATGFSGSGAGLTNIPLSGIQGADELLPTKTLHVYHDVDLDTYEFTDILTAQEIKDILDDAADGTINLQISMTDVDTSKLLKYYQSGNIFVAKYLVFEDTPAIDMTTYQNHSLQSYFAIVWSAGSDTFQFMPVPGDDLATLSQQLMQLLAGKEDLSNKVTSISSSSTDDEYPSAKLLYDTKSALSGLIQDVDEDAEKIANKVTSISSSSTDTQYPSAKCVYDEITNISASHITSGTIASDRLPTADPDTKGALKTVFKNGGSGVQLPLITHYNDGGITIQEYPGSSVNSTCYGLAQTGGIGYTKIPDFTGATSSAAGATGLVPAPSSGDQNKFLRANGQWETILSSSISNDANDESLYFIATNGTDEYYLDKDSNNNIKIGQPVYNNACKTTYYLGGYTIGNNTRIFIAGGLLPIPSNSVNQYGGFFVKTPIALDQNGLPTSSLFTSGFEMMLRVHGCVFEDGGKSRDYDMILNLAYDSTTSGFKLSERNVGKVYTRARLVNGTPDADPTLGIAIGDVASQEYATCEFLKNATYLTIHVDILGVNSGDFRASTYTDLAKLLMTNSNWSLNSFTNVYTFAEWIARYGSVVNVLAESVAMDGLDVSDIVSSTLYASNSLTVDGDADFGGNLDLTNGNLWVNGNIEAEGNIYAPTMSTDSLNVDGAADIDGDLDISGTLTVNNQNLGQVLNYDNVLHGTCSSAASSASKSITLYGSQTADDIKPGTRLQVYFSNINGMPSSGTMTLNIGNNSYVVWVMDKAANAVNSMAQVGPFFKYQRFLTFYISGDNPSRAYIIPNTDVYLKSPYQKEIRPTSMNVTTQAGAYLQYLCATNACTTGKPSINGSVTDAAVLHFNWDNSNLYSAQLAIQSGNATLHGMAYRNQDGTTENSWNAWKTLVDEDNIASYLPSTVELNTNRVTSISSSSTDSEYPTAKCVYDAITGLSGSYITSGTVSSDRLPSASDSTKGILKSTFKNITLGGVTFPTFTQVDDSSITIPEYPVGSGTAYGLAINSYTAYTKIPDLTGASSSAAGVAGLVPAPASGDQDKFLKGDGTWATVSGGGSSAGDDCYYGYCSSSATTPQKVVTISNSGYTITDHVRLFVYFANAHTYSSSKPYLSIDGVTYQIRYYDLNVGAEDTTSKINSILYSKRYMEFYFLTMSGNLVAIAMPDAVPTLFSPYRTSNVRITNLNTFTTTDGAYMKYVIASSNSVTTGLPSINGATTSAMVLHMNWDNANTMAGQIALQVGGSNSQGGMAYRRQNGNSGEWHAWKTLIDEDNISSYLSNTLEYVTNKVTSITSSSTDTQYPSAKAVYDTFWPYNSTTFAKMIRAGGIYVCETAAGTAAKVVAKEGQAEFGLVINSTNNTTDPANEDATSVSTYEHGTRISVIFENANTAQNPTLQLSSTQGATAFPIYVYDKTEQDYFLDYDGEYPLEGLVEFMFIDCCVGQTDFQGWLLLPPVQVSSIKIGSTVVTPSATGQVDLTTAINSLIDAKIAAITNADTTSY